MAKYRIVKLAGYENLYKVQKRFLWFFWCDDTDTFSLKQCEKHIEREIGISGKKDTVVREC